MAARQPVLVVDDERNFCRILEAKLRRSQFAVETAPDAAVALQCLLRQTFSVVLLDVRLPDADGLAVLPCLRAVARRTAFIVMTAYEEEGLRERALLAGASDVLYKPFDLELMVDVVSRRAAELEGLGTPRSTELLSAVRPGQAVVLQIATEGAEEHPARVTGRSDDAFEVMAEPTVRPEIGSPIDVSMVGADAVYQFRTHVVAHSASPSAGLSLATPHHIRRRQRRKHVRVPLNAPVLLTTGDSAGAIDTVARDVSLGGIDLVAQHPVAAGQEVTVSWHLPPSAPSPGPVEASGVVIRAAATRGSEQLGVFQIAVRFRRLAGADRSRLESFINSVSRV